MVAGPVNRARDIVESDSPPWLLSAAPRSTPNVQRQLTRARRPIFRPIETPQILVTALPKVLVLSLICQSLDSIR